MRARWWVVALASFLHQSAGECDRSETPVAETAQVPHGDSWWCYSVFLSNGNESYHSSSCSRSKANCVADAKAERARWSGDKGTRASQGSFDCRKNERAAAFTFHHVVQGWYGHEAFERMTDCESARQSRETADYDEVSTCDVVGPLNPQPFNLELVPEGVGWFCAQFTGESGVRGACRRTKKQCESLVGDKRTQSGCSAQAVAYAVTAVDSVWVFPLSKQCDEAIDQLSYRGLSACSPLK